MPQKHKLNIPCFNLLRVLLLPYFQRNTTRNVARGELEVQLLLSFFISSTPVASASIIYPNTVSFQKVRRSNYAHRQYNNQSWASPQVSLQVRKSALRLRTNLNFSLQFRKF